MSHRIDYALPGMTKAQAHAHFRDDGRAKIGYATGREAIAAMMSMDRTRDDWVHHAPYRCPWCKMIHLGRPRPNRRPFGPRWDEAAGIELGRRALTHMVLENHGSGQKRRRKIRDRFVVAARKLAV